MRWTLGRDVWLELSATRRTCAGFDAWKFLAKLSGMTTIASSRRLRTASSGFSGPSTMVTPACCRSQSTNAGAWLAPTTGMVTSSTCRCRVAMLLNMKKMMPGASSELTITVMIERRSRAQSRISLRMTTSTCDIGVDFMRATPLVPAR
jgi:hypothetical protein